MISDLFVFKRREAYKKGKAAKKFLWTNTKLKEILIW